MIKTRLQATERRLRLRHLSSPLLAGRVPNPHDGLPARAHGPGDGCDGFAGREALRNLNNLDR